jgi:hypothetical protein
VSTVAELTGDKELLKRTMMVENARAQVEARPQHVHSDRSRTVMHRGETSAYLLRRLAREAPKVLERYEKGECRPAVLVRRVVHA